MKSPPSALQAHALTLVAPCTTESSTSTEVTVVLTTPVSLSATSTPSTSRLRSGPSTSQSFPRPLSHPVVVVTHFSPSTTSCTPTVAGTPRPSLTTSSSLTSTPMSGATPTFTTMFLAGITPPSWLRLSPHSNTSFSAVKARTSTKARPVPSALMSTVPASSTSPQ